MKPLSSIIRNILIARKRKKETALMSPHTMSKDRVRFSIPGCQLEKHGMRQIIQEVFDLAPCQYDVGYSEHLTIICRPSQFARFLILRNDRGFQNGFKELDPKLFVPVEPNKPKLVDVSRRANNVRAGLLVTAD